MKEGKYTKTLAKTQVTRIFRMRDIRRNAYLDEHQHGGRKPTWRTETNKNICYRVLVQKREFIPLGTHKH